jgi:2-desacetyl-2-hydroxyethyl bacteriochlorophyllide A dehydrogenase
MGIDSVGAFQEEWIVKARTIHKIPKALSFKHAAMIEPLAVACHDVRLGSVKKGDNVVVLGGGPIGLLISMVAKAAGANIIISEISDYRLSLAQKMGFKTVNPKESDIKEEVMKFTNNIGADVVFEVTATAICAKIMTELPRTRGTMVTVGIFSEPPQIDLFKFFWRELQLKGARVYEEEDFDKAIALAAEGSINFEELISGVYDLDNITDAFKSLEGNATAMKVVVKCS